MNVMYQKQEIVEFQDMYKRIKGKQKSRTNVN